MTDITYDEDEAVEGDGNVPFRRSLLAKILGTITVVCVLGALATALFNYPIVRNGYELSQGMMRNVVTGQLASSVAGAMRWQKADVVADTYKPLITDQSEIRAVLALAPDGTVVASYPAEGTMASDVLSIFSESGEAIMKPGEPFIADDLMVTASPVMKEGEGDLFGHIVIAWGTDAMASQTMTVFWSIVLVGSLAALITIAVIGAVVNRQVTRPLRSVTERIDGLTNGDLDSAVPCGERKDEIGTIGRALELLRHSGHERLRLEGEAATQRAEAEAERQRGTEDRDRSAKELGTAADCLGKALRRLAEGDLTTRVGTELPEAYRRLGNDFDAAVSQLEEAIADVSGGIIKLKSGMSEIANASSDLSSRTEKQAATLEQTTATVSEITSKVDESARGAEDAATTMNKAKADAEASGEIVSRAVSAMGDIEQSSKQISDIIGVIDEIAFQTNLLALNAGVEAARAGEKGLGFAVVAQEVRELAQRSAEAAKQIKSLISISSSQVDDGVVLVRQTGDALQRIVHGMGDISGLVEGISSFSREQAIGLKRVNEALVQLDQVTQQNAAMSEEATAATLALTGQSDGLAQAVARFRVEEHAYDDDFAASPDRHAA
ncbi:methyl-accepting chemotaxis protein [Notoacmeibacter sp. MSK16QG-6]|uniref:methyl-accepting chemotaxis protein n=1 Tax=Notoacmeibacter sp. MSK16QG-6 TaxID=2957982 RepID=UPI00209D5489|nr:methyl-accepting chemotaxis protein [Notoacmeibacter sp. MSK16QG-6]MCP1198982.1 methyl-accepting chemotaxis protein [Notoacmeibacter sp. MSK16QG-6]